MKSDLIEYIKQEAERKLADNKLLINWMLYLIGFAAIVGIFAILVQYASGAFAPHVCMTQDAFLKLMGRG